MQRTRTSLRVLAVLATLVLAACTGSSSDPVPSPSPTSPTATSPTTDPASPPPGRIAVVVSPDPELTASAAEVGLRGIAAGLDDETELRVVRADDASFLVDMASFFATEGYELVCVLGTGAEEAVRLVAPDAPSTRFCAAPARAADMPPNVLPITVRVEELGYLAGVAIAAEGPLEGPAGLVTSLSTWQPQRLRAGFVAGLEAGGVAGPAVRPVGPVGEDVVVDEVTDLLDAGVGAILSLTGALDAVVRDVVAEVPVTPPPPSPPPTPALDTVSPSPSPSPTERFAALVAGPEVRPPEDEDEAADEEEAEPVEPLLLVLELHLEEAVALAVERHLGTWDTAPAAIGVTEQAIRVDVPDGPRAAAVAEAVAQAVEALRAGGVEIATG